jgi:hypothetical protein
MIISFTESTFRLFGGEMINFSGWRGSTLDSEQFNRAFRAHFGIDSLVCSYGWAMLKANSKLPITAEPKHLLWVLIWLKLYKSESAMVSIAKVHRNTFQKWVLKMVIGIADLYKTVVSIVVVV